MRVEQVLAVSRSIGDKDFKRFIISDPEITSMDISYLDSILILATDGIFKSFGKEELSSLV